MVPIPRHLQSTRLISFPDAPFETRRLVALALLVTSSAAALVFADESPLNPDAPSRGSTVSRLLDDQFVVSIGGTRLRGDAAVGASIDGLPPAEIALNDLGLDDNDISYFSDLTYRLNPRWALQASIYSFSAGNRGTATQDFSFGGEDFTVGAELELGLEVDAYLLHASYAAYERGNFDLRVGGGIHALDLGASIRGEVSIGDDAVSGRRSSSSLLAPVPNLRAEARWFLSDKTALTVTTGWLSANVDDYEGEFVYLHLEAVYSFSERIGIAVGYQRTDVDVTESRSNSTISYDVLLDGATLTLKYAF